MWKRMVTAALAAALMLAMAGCGGDSLAGKTLYHVSPFDEDLTTIAFSEDGAAHMTEGNSETMGTWYEEGDNVVITMGSGLFSSTFTLAPDGEGGWARVNGDEWDIYHQSEDEAREWSDEFIAEVPSRVQAILEGNEWRFSRIYAVYFIGMVEYEPATVSFLDGVATYHGVQFSEPRASVDEGDWWVNDHSGSYVFTIEEMSASSCSGTIEIGGDSTEFSLYFNSGNLKLGGVEFMAEKTTE